eukprot:TRINITY_DN417_c2_g1_i2.p1 TRINITY_DN417_c2_g1~~TRINITY_DN417_c2_g1_i2.p1  ORF type:complete len:310 (+),score=27.70 TRINITY_DN417_c2_g1_i2:63-932(+)
MSNRSRSQYSSSFRSSDSSGPRGNYSSGNRGFNSSNGRGSSGNVSRGSFRGRRGGRGGGSGSYNHHYNQGYQQNGGRGQQYGQGYGRGYGGGNKSNRGGQISRGWFAGPSPSSSGSYNSNTSRGVISSGQFRGGSSSPANNSSNSKGAENQQQVFYEKDQLLSNLQQTREIKFKTYFGDDYIINEQNKQPEDFLLKKSPDLYWQQSIKRMPRRPIGPLQEHQVGIWEAFDNCKTFIYIGKPPEENKSGVMNFFIGQDGRLWQAFGPTKEVPVWKCRQSRYFVPQEVKHW